jgi:hypothetical protein
MVEGDCLKCSVDNCDVCNEDGCATCNQNYSNKYHYILEI